MNTIHIKDKDLLQKKISAIAVDGVNKLHIVSDFDRTLTKCFFNGKKIPSTFALIREGGYLSDDYPKKAFAMFDKYNPIELDESLDYEYRYAMMREWWETHRDLFVASGMHKDVIVDILNKFPKLFRDKTIEFFDVLAKKNIPLLIFSSGIGNIIEGYLVKENKLTPNIHILSNTFVFDKDGFATGYKDEVIHLMNKCEHKVTNDSYRRLISERKNIILLGDSLEDLGMIENISGQTVIRVGFLNEQVDEKLELYKDNFDIVISDDSSMVYVLSLVKELCEKEKK